MFRNSLVVVTSFLLASFAHAQTRHGFIISSANEKKIEYFSEAPVGKGPFPLLLLVHPDQASPKTGGKTFVESGQLDFWSKKGFLAVAVSQPGYGESVGPADYCGPATQQSVIDLIDFFKSKTELVSSRIFIYGGSRGAVVASMVATELSGLSGVILKSGVYDFIEWSKSRPWYEPIKLVMFWEVGWLSDEKLKQRSAIYQAAKVTAPVLIIHGTEDDRAPVELAAKFDEAIRKAGGHSEFVGIKSEHVIPTNKIDDLMASFMAKH